MITEYKNWFLENIQTKEFTKVDMPLSQYGRKYEFYNFGRHEVPFDFEFETYLQSFVNDTDFDYECYHVHKWDVGAFFDLHHDDRENRKFSYVCELQESKCKTKLLIEGNPTNEGWFDVNTNHQVPMIQLGQRISLTIFGKNKIKRTLI